MNSRMLASSRRSMPRSCLRPAIARRRVALDQALDVVDLEDRVRQHLGRTIVDLASDARPLGVERLQDHGGGLHRVRSIGVAHGASPGQPIS